MDAVWIQMAIGALGSMVLGIATNLLTPIAPRAFRWCARRVRRSVMMVTGVMALHGLRRRAAGPIRRLATALRA